MLKRLISTLFKLIGDHRNEYASDMLEYVYYWQAVDEFLKRNSAEI